jgi:hypothetical protein
MRNKDFKLKSNATAAKYEFFTPLHSNSTSFLFWRCTTQCYCDPTGWKGKVVWPRSGSRSLNIFTRFVCPTLLERNRNIFYNLAQRQGNSQTIINLHPLPHVLWCEQNKLPVLLFFGYFHDRLHTDSTVNHILEKSTFSHYLEFFEAVTWISNS